MPQDPVSIVKDTINMFCHDVEPSLAAEAASKIVPHSNECFSTPTKHAGWTPYPCAYIVTMEDHVAPPAIFRWMLDELLLKDPEIMKRWDVFKLKSSHSPFLSMPDECLKIIEQYANGTT